MNFNKKLRGFTLVEMLIVIVIIGVLAAALIPRLTSVRGRANDVARKADLQQVATAIVSYSMDKGAYPTSPTTGMSVNDLQTELKNYVTSLPKDPQGNEYTYMTAKKGAVDNAGFIIVAKAETEGGANRAYGSGTLPYTGGKTFDSSAEVQDITPCTKLTQSGSTVDLSDKNNCYYSKTSELRYIIAR